jgi:putative glutamine amidotransferase
MTQDWDGHKSLAQVRVSCHYAESIYKAGGLPYVVPTFTGEGSCYKDGRGWPLEPPRQKEYLMEKASSVLRHMDALLLTGGGDVLLQDGSEKLLVRQMDRDRDFWEAALFQVALDLKKPVLGICRGLQLMNLYLGGTLWRDIPSQYPNALPHQQVNSRTKTTHEVKFLPDSHLADIFKETVFTVNSGHHQAAKTPAPDLKPVGFSSDGLIEAMEYTKATFVLGVQWHPEALASFDTPSALLFQALIEAART